MTTTTTITKTTAFIALVLLLSTSGCMNYWKDVNKLQEENAEMADQLKWQEREQQMKARKAKEAAAPEAPLKASDY